ncbi:oxaloacetate decarboxylase [Tepidamorphus sp. 3E244]|uniref:isocitrate lyase/PEP mutase family protein n=1 Tax=Tepidamorphus sp. 3E244 TaxID=3385498 RepID=UPI0038FC2F82
MDGQATVEPTFRELHEQPGAFVIPNPWDIGSARILESMGFKALATTSAGLAFSLGLPEGSVGRDAVLSHCRDLVSAVNIPVSADMEKGFGDSPEAAAETIIAAAATGLAGCSLEDHTGDPDDPIYPFELAVERVQAAVEAERALDRDFVFTARSENLLWGRDDLDDTIRRLQAFEAAGAGVVYAPGLRDLETIRTVCSAVSCPVNVVMGMPGVVFGVQDLAEAGVSRVSVGSAFARLVYGRLMDAANEILWQGTFTFAREAAAFSTLDDIFRAAGKKA